MRGRLANNPYLLLALAALFWSGNHIIGRAVAGQVPPFGLSTLRWLLPALVLLPAAWPHLVRDWPLIKAHWRILFFLTLTGGALFSALQYVGLQYTTALNVSVLNSLVPVLIVAASALIFGERLHPRQAVGIATSLAGVLVIVSRIDLQALAALQFNIGDLIILFNMTAWAVFSCYLRLRPKIHWLSFMTIVAVGSTLMTAPFFAIEHFSGFTFKPTWLTLFAVLYVAIFPSVAALAAWNRGVELLGANRAGPFLHLVPLYSAVLAYTLLGEQLHLYHLLGFALILGGVYSASRRS
ncbi:MAG TPA: DMT family transporter [Xanthobacteraceae bacterium]|jgi:drug/metabolite transporter (DMT)-like permease